MKLRHFVAVCCLAATAAAYAAGNHSHAHEHKPLHGGLVVEVKDMDFELVAKPDVLQLYVRDHGKPVDTTKASAKITLLSGADKQDVELKAKDDKLEARGNFKVAAGTKAAASVVIGGKSISARFVVK